MLSTPSAICPAIPCQSLEVAASGGVVREAHGRGPGPEIRFDIDDSGLTGSKGTFQCRTNVGRGLDILAMATKGIHELFIPLVAQLTSDLPPIRISSPATVHTDHRYNGKIVPYRGIHLHGVHAERAIAVQDEHRLIGFCGFGTNPKGHPDTHSTERSGIEAVSGGIGRNRLPTVI